MTVQFPFEEPAPIAQSKGPSPEAPNVPARPTPDRSIPGRAIILVYAVLAILLAIPILAAEVPLGVDDFNHLSRIYVRAHIASDSDLAHFFRIRTDIIPYLGMDLLLTPVARVLPIMLVGRLYILALVWGVVGAVVVLQRAFTGRIGFEPAAAGIFAYNGLLAWGLINYLLGIILALLLLAGWHSQRRRYWLTRLLLFTCAATLLYITHVFAFALYGIMVVSYEVLSRPTPWRTPLRDWMVLVGQAVPSLLLWRAISNKLIGAGFTIEYFPWFKLVSFGSPFIFDSAAGGPKILMSLEIILVGCVILYISTARGWLTWCRPLAGPVLLLLALTAIMPYRAFGVALLDYRFALPAACLAFAGLRIAPPLMPRGVLAIGAIALLTLLRTVEASAVMHRCDSQYAELRNALAALPRGVELTTVLEKTDPVPGVACTSLPIYLHMAQLVTIDRSGFAHDFFAIVTSVGVRDGMVADTDPESAETFVAGPPGGYVLWIHLGRHRQPPAGFVLLREGSFFDLWSVRV
jgi:hypothetical protein